MTDQNNETYERVILLDRPSDSDSFSGGGHLRTARALAKTIRRFEGKDHSIGLEGSWGSGKSTIVNLATDELENSDKEDKHHVFTFDLWANQTTHFRRAFLENFLKWGQEKFPKQKRFVEQKKKEVGDRTKVIETNNKRQFDWFGIVVVGFLFAIPALYTWFSPFAFKGTAKIDLIGLPIGTSISLSLTVLMLIALIIYAKSSRIPGSKWNEGWIDGFSKALSVFSKEHEKTTVTQNIRDEDPTQYEFHKIFREIVEKFQADGARLVLVFDNIDRLPSDRISDIWSEVRSVFQTEQSNIDHANAITGIVPYDRSVAIRAMKGSQDGDLNDYIIEDVFRKSFDAIHHVSPPVLSDASKFFADQCSKATKGKMATETANCIYRIFDLYVGDNKAPATPRQVIAFINSVMSWWELRGGDIPFESIAVFVAHQSKIESNPGILNEGREIDDRMRRHANQNNLNRDLAALAYNVSLELALQVSLEAPITRALISADSDSLKVLSENSNSNGFYEILPKVIEKNAADWAEKSPIDFAHAISNLNDLGNISDAHFSRVTLANQSRLLKTVELEKIEELAKIFLLQGFVDSSKVKEVFEDLIKWINSSLPNADEQTFEHGQMWVKRIGNLCDACAVAHGNAFTNKMKTLVSVPASVQATLGVAYDIDETNCEFLEFKPISNKLAVLQELQTEVIQPRRRFHFSWKQIKSIFDQKDSYSLLKALAEHMKTSDVKNDSENLHPLLSNLVQVYNDNAKTKNVRDLCEDLSNSGALIHHAYQVKDEDDEKAISIIARTVWFTMAVSGTSGPVLKSPEQMPTFGNMQASKKWFDTLYSGSELKESHINQIAEFAIDAGNAGPIFSGATKNDPSKELYRSVTKAIIRSERTHLPRVSIIAHDYDNIIEMLEDDAESLLVQLGNRESDEYWKDIDYKQVSNALIEDAASRSEKGWAIFLKNLDDWLVKISANDWSNALENQADEVRLLKARRSSKQIQIPSANLSEPLSSYILSTLSGSIDTNIDHSEVLASLPSATKTALPKEIFERHDTYTKNINAALKAFPDVMDKLPFTKDADKAVERYLLPLVKANTALTTDFVESHKMIFRKVIKNASDGQLLLLNEYLDGLRDDEEQSDYVQKICGILGIKRKNVVSEVTDDKSE